MSDKTPDFAEELYTFLGYSIKIKSNSPEVLKNLRSVYGRFYAGNDEAASNPSNLKRQPSQSEIEIIDNISHSKELIINDGSNAYHLKCNDIHSFDYDYYTFAGTVPNPLAYVQWVVLDTVCNAHEEYQLFHAGAVSWKDMGIIFPALSGMGKTTLTLKLVQQGFKFLSDEVACLDHDEEIIKPFPRKLNLSDQSRRLLDIKPMSGASDGFNEAGDMEWKLDIEEVVPSGISDPCSLRYIIFLKGFGERPRLEFLSSANALFKLFRFSLRPNKNVANLLYKFAPILNNTGCYNLVLGDLDETAQLILDLVEDSPVE